MRKICFYVLFVFLFTLAQRSEAATYSTTSWEIIDGVLTIEYTGSSVPLKIESTPEYDTCFEIKGIFPADTQININEDWILVIADGSLITVSDKSKLKTAKEDRQLVAPAVSVSGSNTITLNAPGIYMSAWYTGVNTNINHARKEHPDYIAAHYQAWYREPRFSSQDSPGVPDNYEYNWTWRQHGNEDKIKFFSADKTVDGQGEIVSYQYPLTNFYDSRDGDLQKYHAALMKMAGINAVIFDFYGAVDIADYKNPRVNSDAFIRNVLDHAGISYLVFYEEFSAFVKDYGQERDVTREEARERARKSFEWLNNNWFNRGGYVKYNGRPVVMIFVTKDLFSTREEWENIAKEAGVNPVPYFVCHYNSLPDYLASFNWMPVNSNFSSPAQRKYYTGSEREKIIKEDFEWFSNITADNEFCIATAYPGFDDSVYDELDRACEYGSHNAILFDGGATFRQAFDLALEMKPNIIQLGTWNDYNEDTVTEPTTSSLCHKKTEAERGYLSLEYVQSRKKEWENSGWTAEDLRAPLELYKLSKSPAVTPEEKIEIDKAYEAIFNDDPETFRNIAASLIDYDSSVRPLLRAEILTTELSEGTQGQTYAYSLSAKGTPAIVWTAENLPDGLTCSSSGVVSGTPTVSGTFSVKITASNSAGNVSKTLQLSVQNDRQTATGKSSGGGGCNSICLGLTSLLMFVTVKKFR